MNPPGLECRVEMSCAVNPSESRDKVGAAVGNIFPGCTMTYENYTIRASSNDIKSLEKIRTHIRSSRSQKTYRRILARHADQNSTWFYLNKQAAFAKKVAICEQPDESPLGPIMAVLTSDSMDDVIAWLTGSKFGQEN